MAEYTQEVVDLTMAMPFRVATVHEVYEMWGRDIKKTELVLRYHLITGRWIGPDSLEALRVVGLHE